MTTVAFESGLAAFAARDFTGAQQAWGTLADSGDDRVLTYLAEYRYVNGDHGGSRDLAMRRGLTGEGVPSASVQFARAAMMTSGADDPVVVPVLTKADADGDPDAAAWLAEALYEIGDAGASGRMWRKAAQRGSALAVRRVIEHLTRVDPAHPEIAGWRSIAKQRGLSLDSGGGSAFGKRELPETALTQFIRGEILELPAA